MHRMLLSVRRAAAGRMVSALALAAAGAGVVATAAMPQVAMAQAEERNSRGFGEVYQPLSEQANAEGADFNAIKGQLPTLIAAIENNADRHVAGNMVLITGNNLSDKTLQRQGLELMLESGRVPPEQVGQFNFFVGSLAYEAQDFEAARAGLQAAKDAGYTEQAVEGLIAESYFGANQFAEGLDYLKGEIDTRAAAGQPVDAQWLRRGLAVAYENNLGPQATDWAALLVANDPSPQNWTMAIQVVNAVNSFEPQAQLDLLRLMMKTNSLTERRDLVTYIETADARIMANEVDRVLAAGTQAGVFSPSDEYYTEVKRIVDGRKDAERAEAPSMAEEAQSGASPTAARNAGDVFLAIEDYAQAEAMYKLALEQPSGDKDQALTRIGIAQAQQGKLEEAKATFAQVSGTRAPVAKMWTAYIDSQA